MAKPKSKSDQIITHYIKYVLEHGEDPPTVYAFTKKAKIKEAYFFKHYGSFEGMKTHIWKRYMQQTIDSVEADPIYSNYTVKEKLLAFYYTHIEVLRKHRSFILATAKGLDKPGKTPVELKGYRKKFLAYASQLIEEGRNSNQVKERKYIATQYHHGLWIQCLFVLNYWIKDKSLGAENTDAAIEKSVNVSFDLISEGNFENLLDLGKFLFQTWKF